MIVVILVEDLTLRKNLCFSDYVDHTQSENVVNTQIKLQKARIIWKCHLGLKSYNLMLMQQIVEG